MSNRLRARFCATLGALLLLHPCGKTLAEGVQYKQVSRETIEVRLGKYAGNNKQREATLKQMFADAGCDDQHLSEQPVKDSKLPNVICVLPGSTDKTIIVGAHFDCVPDGHGVVDNWSGASLLPSLYESLKAVPRRHSYIFIGFTDEERGLVGSSSYVHQMTKDQVAATTAMVNMNTLGLGPTEIWGSRTDKRLNSAIAYVAKQLDLPVSSVGLDGFGGNEDSESFAERKIPRIMITSLTPEAWRAHILHTPKDALAAMQLDKYYDSYRLIAAYIAFLDQVGVAAPATKP